MTPEQFDSLKEGDSLVTPSGNQARKVVEVYRNKQGTVRAIDIEAFPRKHTRHPRRDWSNTVTTRYEGPRLLTWITAKDWSVK